MAVTLTKFREKLDNKLWGTNSVIARDIIVYNIAGSTVDDYGEQYDTMDSGTSEKAIPYNKFTYQRDHLQWGELKAGQTDMVFKYDSVISNGSLVVDSNETTTSYEVQNIEKFPYGNGSVAQVVRLQELL